MNIKQFSSFIYVVSAYFFTFILLYLEPLVFFGVKFAILWKVPVIIFLSYYFVNNLLYNGKIPLFVFFGLLLSIKVLFSLSSFEYFISTLSEFSKLIVFVLLFSFIKNRISYEYLCFTGRHISIFVVLSFIPFQLNLIEPLGKSFSLDKYGIAGSLSLTGVFQNPHGAAFVLATSMLVIFYLFLMSNTNKNKIIYFLFLALGTIEIIQTYVRTPLVILLIGGGIIAYKFFKLKQVLMVLVLLGIISIIYSSFSTNNAINGFQMRLSGENIYNSTGGVGSGRLMFWDQAIINWQSEGLPSIVVGLGIERAKDAMEKGVGLRLFAHNGFIQQLQSDGIIGFLLMVMFYYYLYLYIKKYKNSEGYILTIAIYVSFVIFTFFQGGNYFLFYFILSIYLSMLSKNNKDVTHAKKNTNSYS